MDLLVGTRVVARAGTRGVVLSEFSDTRLTVAFDTPSDNGGQSCFNVLPLEIRPWCETPEDFTIGTKVRVVRQVEPLPHPSAAVIRSGAVGVVLGGVDASHALITFVVDRDLPPRHVLLEYVSIERIEEESFSFFQQRHGGGSGAAAPAAARPRQHDAPDVVAIDGVSPSPPPAEVVAAPAPVLASGAVAAAPPAARDLAIAS